MSSPPKVLSAQPFQAPGPFAREVNSRGRAALAGIPRFGNSALARRVAGFAALGVLAYGRLLLGSEAMWEAAASIAVSAFCAFMMIVLVGHDASHGAVSSRRWLNRATLFWSFAILGVDGAQWRDRHIRLHHQVVNLPGTGIDADSVSLIRLDPDKPWHWMMRFQPLYAPLIYMLGHVSLVWIEDFVALRALRREGRREFVGFHPLTRFACGKAVHVVLFLAIPWLILRPSFGALMLGYLFASSLIALCFVVLVVGTHVSDIAEFPRPDANGRVAHDWATHQLITSVDWSPENRIAVLFSGGANAHVAHHLFPGYNHCHLATLSRVIAETAAEHGLEHRVTSLAGMVFGQWRHLVEMSRQPRVDIEAPGTIAPPDATACRSAVA